MWETLITAVIGLVSVAAASQWIAGRRTRQMSILLRESELLSRLPEGAARDSLQEHLEDEVAGYLRYLRRGRLPAHSVVAFVAILGGTAAFAVGASLQSFDSLSDAWEGLAVGLFWSGAAIATAGWLVNIVSLRKALVD